MSIILLAISKFKILKTSYSYDNDVLVNFHNEQNLCSEGEGVKTFITCSVNYCLQ